MTRKRTYLREDATVFVNKRGRRRAGRIVARQLGDVGGVAEVPAVVGARDDSWRWHVPEVARHSSLRLRHEGVDRGRSDENAVMALVHRVVVVQDVTNPDRKS